MGAGLFVLPGARQEDRDVDLVHEERRVQRVGDLGLVIFVVGAHEGIHGLAVELLVVGAGRDALRRLDRDLIELPSLSVGRRLIKNGLGPIEREPVVEDAAGGECRCRRAGDDRERGDCRESGGLGLRREELADARVGEASHADVVVEHPLLVCDGFDDVVAIEYLEGLEEVVGAAGTAGASHVDAHGCEAE